ncbi:MAG: hypothetical protein ACOYYJ_17495 [Chloroflexota bacterium]
MKQRLYAIVAGVSIFLLATLACNLQAGNKPAVQTPPAPGNVHLSVMHTLTAVAILNPPLQPQLATPVFTAPASLAPSPGLSPTSALTMVTVSMDTNCRSGPGKVYDHLGALLAGEQTEVVGWDGVGEYWYVKNPDQPGGFCWLWGQYATLTGDWKSLPQVAPPPTPTQTQPSLLQPVYITAIATIAPTANITIVNNGGATIFYVYISLSTASDWGSDRLVSSTIPAGGSFTFTVAPGTYDIKAEGSSHDVIKTWFGMAVQGNITLSCP